MNAEQFLQLINRQKSPNKQDALEAKKLQEVFPYFLAPHVISAIYESKKKPDETPGSLASAAINSSDRIWLKSLIYHLSTEKQPSLNKVSPALKKEDSKPTRRKSKGDELIENIRNREKKEILDEKKKEQINLIREFSKKSIKLATIKEIESNQNKENLAESSTKFNSNAVSESLASILTKQGKLEMAIEIYEKLMLKFPDKSAYFADLIRKLKE